MDALMRLGIFGGSFDPIHLGHLILAEWCREQANLDQIWFVPCSVQPLKPNGPQASNRQRAEMIELALSGAEHFSVSKIEMDRGETSYTVETLAQIKDAHPDHELFLLMGSDSLASFPQWRQPEKILDLATPIVVARTGTQIDLGVFETMVQSSRFEQIKSLQFDFPLVELSSTEIRSRVGLGKSIRYQTPRAVEVYIRTQKLYAAS